jgi:acetylornithine deacetylase
MGRGVSGPEYGESRMTDLLSGICESHGWPYVRQPVHPGRDNLLAVIAPGSRPSSGGEFLLWDVHQDTVAADGMTVPPFGGEIRDGRVYGRGASDVKGSMAAMLAALSRVTESGPASRPTIVLSCTVNEECGFTGATALASLWSTTRQAADTNITQDFGDVRVTEVLQRKPDAAIVAEPTLFNVIVAHQGQVRWRCHTIGVAAHTSRPDIGINAIYGMAQVVQAIERFHRELTATGPDHRLCGRPSVCVSTIRGGVGVNTVPERATIEIDRRLAPNESPDAAYGQLIQYIAKSAELGRCGIEHDAPFMQSTGLSDQNNEAAAGALQCVVRERGPDSKICGAPYGTDAAAFSAAGIPTVVFGPGSIDQAHTADEYISIDELKLGSEIFYDIACRGLR